MNGLFVLGAVLVAAPVAAHPGLTSLPGVSDKETVISYGGIQEFQRGHGDVLFVRDSADRWYRLQLNQGCLSGPVQAREMVFETGTSSRIDRFTMVSIPRDLRRCGIESIRRSAPPPQVDSHSPVTLD